MQVMGNKKLAAAFALLMLASSGAFAQSNVYFAKVVPEREGGIRYRLPYSLGTHEGVASAVTGMFKIDLAKPESTSGSLKVPLDLLVSGDAKRDCHMREALGLKYEASDFPQEHVCNDENLLPTSGRNSIAYPAIELKVTSVKSMNENGQIADDRETSIEVEGKWVIHGVSQPAKIPMRVVPENGRLRLSGETALSLKSFGVEVKSARLLFVTISVSDQVKLTLDLYMELQKKPLPK